MMNVLDYRIIIAYQYEIVEDNGAILFAFISIPTFILIGGNILATPSWLVGYYKDFYIKIPVIYDRA